MIGAAFRYTIAVPGAVFVLIGLAWIAAPGFAGEAMQMALLDGAGRATQIADIGTFFLAMGGLTLAGSLTGNRQWLFPVIGMLGSAAVARTLAWAVHGAALTADMIAVEVVVGSLLVAAATVGSSPPPGRDG